MPGSAASRTDRLNSALALLAAASVPPTAQLDIEAALRNTNGVVRLCVTRRPASFPGGCEQDPDAVKLTAPAALQIKIILHDLAPGEYAVALFHDENGNGRLDRWGPLPTEGFGFSRNPRLGFGPPSFRQASFTIGAGEVRQVIKIHYLL